MPPASLDVIFQPRSVAIVGASDDPSRIGGRPLAHALAHGYAGKIYPVNPARDAVQGLRSYKSILDLPDSVDCAIIALPEGQVAPTLEQCAARGVRGAVVFSGGFAELGEAGIRSQARLREIARVHGIRMLGPNCIGSYSVRHHAYQTFLTNVPLQVHEGQPRLGLVSQSGGYGAHILQLALRRGLVVEKLATTGNEADVELGEVIRWMAESDDIDIIVAYIEGVRSKETFIEGLRTAHAQRKPVILLKVGATAEGAAAAASHTAALAGADAVYDAVLRDYGALRAESTEHVLDIVYALSNRRQLRSRKLCVTSVSGGAGVQLADFASHYGLQLPAPPPEAQARLREIVPFGSPKNPVDITAQIVNQPEIFEKSLDILLDAGYDSIVTWLGPAVSNVRAGTPMREAVERAVARHPDAQLTFSMFSDDEALAPYHRLGCLIFEEPQRAMRALASLEHLHAGFARALPATPDLGAAPLLQAGKSFNEAEAKQVLSRIGVGLLDERLVRTPDEAGEACHAFGRPVAIKVVSPDIMHKSDVGGVALGITTPQDAVSAVQRMAAALAERAPAARVEGYLVSPMLSGGTECIVGIHSDPLFGPVVMFGIGGVLVELVQDVAFAMAPLDEAGALALVQRVKGHRLLTGFRNAPAGDMPALARAIAALSQLASRNADRLQTLEINPLVVMSQGQGVIALDAVLTTVDPPQSSFSQTP